ncbi:MAG: M28 family metallopeptidase [Chloroflexi bacterium]|nr:M28 family metallopeptidase [Chloroflexota bacterium]
MSPTGPTPHITIRRLMLAAFSLVAIAASACSGESSTGATDTGLVSATPTSALPATATATAISPTATSAPTATASSPAARALQSPSVDELAERALAHVRVLSEDLPPRVSGTDGELTAASYIADELRSYGYEVELQDFIARIRPRNGNHLEITGSVPSSITTNIFSGSGEGEATGPLIFVGLGRESDLPDFSLAGTVALVERGQIPFETKATNVFGAGAEGMVVFNNVAGIFEGTLGDEEFDRPAVTISRAEGQALVTSLRTGAVNVRLRLVTEERTSQNVVASMPARQSTSGDAARAVVVIGGHYDAVPGSPGANDNATGTATILVLAEELASADLPFDLRVIGFGSEELGLLGSAAYIDSLDDVERSRIAAMLNYDALGAGTLEIGGHFRLSGRALEVAVEIGETAVPGIAPPGSSSDHASFSDAGIPSMFFFGSDFSMIHTPQDAIDAVNPELMGQAAAITLNGLLDGIAE